MHSENYNFRRIKFHFFLNKIKYITINKKDKYKEILENNKWTK